MKYQLKVIIGSTRPSRKGHLVAKWFVSILKDYPDFDVEVLDLKEIDLPFMNEPEHPRLQKYTHPHTLAWSKKIDAADAFVMVTPEYNYSYPATLKNALDYLVKEWESKPMAFVSYGGLSGGTRAVQALKLPVTTLGMMPLPQAVNIPYFNKFINKDNVFEADDALVISAHVMMDKLTVWTKTLKEMREIPAV